VVLTVSALTCGFFWEMWNGGSAGYHWVYTVPYVGGMPHLFEMPLLGYLGYPPFAWSTYAVCQFALGQVRGLRPARRRAVLRDRRAGVATAAGQPATPGRSAAAGHSAAAPGQSEEATGRSGTAPGNSGAASGQSAAGAAPNTP
jgi:hypothetical protein